MSGVTRRAFAFTRLEIYRQYCPYADATIAQGRVLERGGYASSRRDGNFRTPNMSAFVAFGGFISP